MQAEFPTLKGSKNLRPLQGRSLSRIESGGAPLRVDPRLMSEIPIGIVSVNTEEVNTEELSCKFDGHYRQVNTNRLAAQANALRLMCSTVIQRFSDMPSAGQSL
jgi:hypothetical protein